jgi:hypothetical protein
MCIRSLDENGLQQVYKSIGPQQFGKNNESKTPKPFTVCGTSIWRNPSLFIEATAFINPL